MQGIPQQKSDHAESKEREEERQTVALGTERTERVASGKRFPGERIQSDHGISGTDLFTDTRRIGG